MAEVSELDAIKSIDAVLSGVSDPLTRDRILRWAWAKFSAAPPPTGERQEEPIAKRPVRKKAQKERTKKPAKGKAQRTILKDLDLRPGGKKSFEDFAKEKQPASDREKCLLAVYYVSKILETAPVGADHVFTCFKLNGWRVPANLDNTLQWVASQRGWLDTSDMTHIRLTTHGENVVEHDLPKAKKASK